ncbi:hypothetical protein NUM3379_39360 [Kineococcus sp. NUM-3379]
MATALPHRTSADPPLPDRAPDPAVPPAGGGRRVLGMSPAQAGRVRDLLAILFCVLTTAVTTGAYLEGDAGFADVPEPALALSAVVALLSAPLLWWRRRRPVTVAVVTALLALVSFSEASSFIALMTLAVRRRDRVLLLVSVLSVTTTTVGTWLLGRESFWLSLGGSAVFAGLFVAVGAYIGARRALVHSLRERAERAESEQALRADQARLAERTRIAREMHDVLAHRISLVALHAGGLEVRPDVGPEQVEATAATIRATSRAALEDLRRVLGVLRTDGPADSAGAAELVPQPTLADLQRLVADSRAAGVPVELRTEVSLHTEVPVDLGRTVYRIVQEALTNVHKHARSAQAVVTLGGRPGSFLCVEVVNGRPAGGAPLLPGSGSGLVGLSERVGIADGTLVSGPEPDGGFAVRARLPWPSPDPGTGDGAQVGERPTWAPPDARIVAPLRPMPGDE